MTICPIAIAAGCKKCPAFSICPLKSSLGDQPRKADAKTADTASSARKPKS
jgi:hypothetical protein